MIPYPLKRPQDILISFVLLPLLPLLRNLNRLTWALQLIVQVLINRNHPWINFSIEDWGGRSAVFQKARIGVQLLREMAIKIQIVNSRDVLAALPLCRPPHPALQAWVRQSGRAHRSYVCSHQQDAFAIWAGAVSA